jgi:hypothetical protein
MLLGTKQIPELQTLLTMSVAKGVGDAARAPPAHEDLGSTNFTDSVCSPGVGEAAPAPGAPRPSRAARRPSGAAPRPTGAAPWVRSPRCCSPCTGRRTGRTCPPPCTPGKVRGGGGGRGAWDGRGRQRRDVSSGASFAPPRRPTPLHPALNIACCGAGHSKACSWAYAGRWA